MFFFTIIKKSLIVVLRIKNRIGYNSSEHFLGHKMTYYGWENNHVFVKFIK